MSELSKQIERGESGGGGKKKEATSLLDPKVLQNVGIARTIITLGHAAKMLADEVRKHSYGERPMSVPAWSVNGETAAIRH